jgi:hypothetical protein
METVKTCVRLSWSWLFIFLLFLIRNHEWDTVNYRISPRHANSPEWLVLGLKYSPKSFYTRIWRAVVSHTVSFHHCFYGNSKNLCALVLILVVYFLIVSD